MVGLWADGWFYLSAAGFLISSVLFVFLLGQYRAAVEAEEESVEAVEARPHTLRPDFEEAPKPRPAAVEKTVAFSPGAPVPVAKPAPKPAPAPLPSASAEAVRPPAPKPAPAPAPEKTEPGNGSLSPAIGLIREIKEHMDGMEKVMGHVDSLADRQAVQNDSILAKLDEIAELLKAQAAAAAAQPQPQAPAPEPAPEPREVQAPPAPEPEPAPPEPEAASAPAEPPRAEEPASAEPDKTSTLEIQLNSPSGTGEEAPEQPRPPRKGPVWPI